MIDLLSLVMGMWRHIRQCYGPAQPGRGLCTPDIPVGTPCFEPRRWIGSMLAESCARAADLAVWCWYRPCGGLGFRTHAAIAVGGIRHLCPGSPLIARVLRQFVC
jgi:hypothetical protein